MPFTKQARPSANFTKTGRPISAKSARFGFAKFGEARFGQTDGWYAGKVARPSQNFTKTARPS